MDTKRISTTKPSVDRDGNTEFPLVDGYSRAKVKMPMRYRNMTIAEAKKLVAGSHVDARFNTDYMEVRRVKVNGKPRTWVKSAQDVAVPIKYGMYIYMTFETQEDGGVGTIYGTRLVVKIEEEV